MADLERDFPGYRGPYRDGKLHVSADRCSTCVFRPGNLMNLGPDDLQRIVRENREQQSALTCHQTLPYGAKPQQEGAVCRGYWDAYKDREAVLILAERVYRIVQEVPCPTPSASEAPTRAGRAAGPSTEPSTTSTGKPGDTPVRRS